MTSDDAPLAPYVPAHGKGVEGDYLVWLAYNEPSAEIFLARAGIEAGQVYRTWDAGFGAVLTGEQVEAVRRIPGVALVEQDTEGRPTPYTRATPGERVDGSYIVEVAPGADPTVVAARLGIAPTAVLRHALLGFGAEMSDVQLDRVRRDPEVTHVWDDARMYVAD
ncbi:hypothetical protein ABZV78_02840 [Micromonospora sp. NPDC004540]|uniref:hypothetical protein n=1 Tax=Micromonospora sp. NPDC004540 TaxID=3154457 RepID=UPI0033A7EA2F